LPKSTGQAAPSITSALKNDTDVENRILDDLIYNSALDSFDNIQKYNHEMSSREFNTAFNKCSGRTGVNYLKLVIFNDKTQKTDFGNMSL